MCAGLSVSECVCVCLSPEGACVQVSLCVCVCVCVSPEGACVQVSLELSLPASAAQSLQDTVADVGQLELRVSLGSDQSSIAPLLRRHQHQPLAPPAGHTDGQRRI